MTDTELLRQAQGGDLIAWRSLYARCLPSVWRQALAMVGDDTVAEEIVSETLLALVRNIAELDADTVQLHSWLRGVVRHKVADYGRQRSKQTKLQVASQIDATKETDLNSASATIEAEEDRLQVLAVLKQLPDLQQIMLEWKHVDGLSIHEIAERTGQTEKSVESTLYRARKEFRRLYELIHPIEVQSENHSGQKTGTLEKSL